MPLVAVPFSDLFFFFRKDIVGSSDHALALLAVSLIDTDRTTHGHTARKVRHHYQARQGVSKRGRCEDLAQDSRPRLPCEACKRFCVAVCARNWPFV